MRINPRNMAIVQGTPMRPNDLGDEPGLSIPTVAVTYCGWVREGRSLLVERLIAGKPVDAQKRTMFPLSSQILADSLPQDVPTGEYGFLDFMVIAAFDVETSPRSHPIPAIQLYRIGIEPEYHHRGYGLQLVRRLGEIAEARGIHVLVSPAPTERNFPSLRSPEQLGFVQEGRYVCGTVFYPYHAPIPLVIPGLPKLDPTIVMSR